MLALKIRFSRNNRSSILIQTAENSQSNLFLFGRKFFVKFESRAVYLCRHGRYKAFLLIPFMPSISYKREF
jgi:hypothetical protein